MTTVVLTGYNTDIDHSGTTYHVQTEDKGRGNPLVESLVYTSGEILYSRRTPYDDLVEQDVDREAIATLMERQHRSIVDAVHSGGLARLTGKIEVAADDDTTITHREATGTRTRHERGTVFGPGDSRLPRVATRSGPPAPSCFNRTRFRVWRPRTDQRFGR